MWSDKPLLHAFSDGKAYAFAAAEELRSSYFGGPNETTTSGVNFGPAPLHQVARLSASDIPALANKSMSLPLLFGLRYSGCELSYRVDSSDSIELLNINPEESSETWPYSNYPAFLPYIQLELVAAVDREWHDFKEQHPSLISETPSSVCVVLPPPMTIGMSLWGRYGDMERVRLVWDFDANSKTVRGYSLCS